jgi:SAM-dependent methyltransferase
VKLLLGREGVTAESGKGGCCNLCGWVGEFAPLSPDYLDTLQRYGHIHSIFLMETLNLKSYLCKGCGATDRDRLIGLFFQNDLHSATLHEGVLEIAPSIALARFLVSRYKTIKYRSADLFMEGVDDCIDVSNMVDYPDGSWGYLICSHVLEHVEDDARALSEIYRVLAPGGVAILLAPINLGLDLSLESVGGESEEQRWKLYGQGDHLRIYSKKDFMERIRGAGFELRALDVGYFRGAEFEKHGIYQSSVLYVAVKPRVS